MNRRIAIAALGLAVSTASMARDDRDRCLEARVEMHRVMSKAKAPSTVKTHASDLDAACTRAITAAVATSPSEAASLYFMRAELHRYAHEYDHAEADVRTAAKLDPGAREAAGRMIADIQRDRRHFSAPTR
jgi:hypothetical protein